MITEDEKLIDFKDKDIYSVKISWGDENDK